MNTCHLMFQKEFTKEHLHSLRSTVVLLTRTFVALPALLHQSLENTSVRLTPSTKFKDSLSNMRSRHQEFHLHHLAPHWPRKIVLNFKNWSKPAVSPKSHMVQVSKDGSLFTQQWHVSTARAGSLHPVILPQESWPRWKSRTDGNWSIFVILLLHREGYFPLFFCPIHLESFLAFSHSHLGPWARKSLDICSASLFSSGRYMPASAQGFCDVIKHKRGVLSFVYFLLVCLAMFSFSSG